MLFAAAACGDDGGNNTADATPRPDASITPDATPDGPPAAVEPDHLVISEVSVRNENREFIEILNPTNAAIDLTNYYLTDDHEYFKLPAIVAGNLTVGRSPAEVPAPDVVLADTDFMAKFPDGATIAAKEIVVIAFHYERFTSVSGFNGLEPDYVLTFDDPNNVPAGKRMVSRNEGGIDTLTGNAQLTNDGEGVALFTWDPADDLVKDVDMVHAGTPTLSVNELRSKSGEQVDGPDADPDASIYASDAFTLGFLPNLPDTGLQTFQRVAFETDEVTTGGNGITGHDETSESLSKSWINDRTGNPTMAPELCAKINGCTL